MSVVYVLGTKQVDGFPIKIGISDSCGDRRIGTLQTGAPYKLETFFEHHCVDSKQARFIERRAQELLMDCRTYGEWFLCGLEDAINAIVASSRHATSDAVRGSFYGLRAKGAKPITLSDARKNDKEDCLHDDFSLLTKQIPHNHGGVRTLYWIKCGRCGITRKISKWDLRATDNLKNIFFERWHWNRQ